MNSPLDDPPQNFKVEIEGRSFYINPKKPLPMLIRPRTERKDGMKYKTEKVYQIFNTLRCILNF